MALLYHIRVREYTDKTIPRKHNLRMLNGIKWPTIHSAVNTVNYLQVSQQMLVIS